MSRIDITLSGLDAALGDLRAVPGDAQAAAQEAVEATAAATKRRAGRLTTQRYNIDEQTLDPFIDIGKIGAMPGGGAFVRLKAKPIPISAFDPRVRMRSFTLTSSAGRRYSRKLPTVWIKRFRSGSAKQLKPFFTLHQRADGPTTDEIRRRIGAARGRLTVPRFYTFPKRFLQEIEPQLVEFVGQQGLLDLRAAWRKRMNGYRVLRGPR